MTKTPLNRMRTIAVLAGTLLLTLVLPGVAGAAQPEHRELDGWIYGRGAAEYAPRSDGFSDDGWARGQGLRDVKASPQSASGGFVDGWAVGQGLRDVSGSRQPAPGTFVDGWAIGQGLRSQPSPATAATPSTAPVKVPTQVIVLGLLLAAVLGAGAATVINHFRHVPSAR